ncbi:MAG: excinuclease ABC subunit UvrC [Betaproteobacteria bacterium]|nr:excinuclease ABC subunit UvrC [Betaproteobacteria bacterium]
MFLSGLPGLPGVYRMFNSEGEMLYVGKARDLKKRVSSYFQKGGHGPRISMMLTQVAGVEVTVTRSEGEALILESNLIKSLAPRYNILFRDDKSYPYLVLGGEQFSRLGFHRGAMDKADKYFGPFPHAGAVRESIQLLQRVFRLRTCDKSVFSNRSRPCLLHQIHRCSAPCVGLIATEQYAEDVRDAKLFLEGRSDDVVARLAARMQHASDAQRFEDAALYRDQIQSLSKVKQRQYADTGSDLDADIIGLAQDHGLVCVNLVMVRGGRHLGDRSFFPQNAQGQPSDEVLRAFIAQHYLDRPAPDVIVVGETVPEMELLLAEHTGHKVHVVAAPTGERRAGLEMARKNAAQAIRQRLLEQGAQEARLAAMRDALGLPESIKRIECFDASHTQGEATVTSCVVYDGHDMRRSDYRRYNISGVTPGDDYGAIKQALTRRYANLASGEGVAPDLIMIDGGKGQIHTARDALAEIGLSDILILGIAKGPGRKPGLEELWLGDAAESITLPPEHPGLHLLQSIRDEAHRFAITGHRARRAKRRVTSTLEGISGIGAKRRRQLLTHFGGIKGIMGASVEDLAQVEGISLKLADKLYQVLHAS